MNWFNETLTGYRYDKRIAFVVMLLFLSGVFYVFYANSFDFSTHPYFKCNQELCENPFYLMTDCQQQINILFFIPLYKTEDCKLSCDWCNEELLSYGEYGEKPKEEWLMKNIGMIAFALIIVGILLNHFLHNRGKKFDIEIKVTDKIRFNLQKIIEGIGSDEKPEDNGNK